MTTPMPIRAPEKSRWLRARRACLVGSGLIGGALTILYAARPDACAAVTVFPAWAWLIPGLVLAAPGLSGTGRIGPLVVLAAWVGFLLLSAEEPWSLARGLLRVPEAEPGLPLRVVTLNCNVGDRRAAEEVAGHHPDIVLLQESPNRAEVEALALRLFGPEAGFVHGVDASLIARGRVVAADLPPTQRGAFVQARITLQGGREIEVISARLIPAVFRIDLWSPDCWREQAENRRLRREQLRAIASRVARSPRPVIFGGDFNAPQGDGIVRVLRPGLRDAFASAGRGWADTITNGFPALRIDAVWIGDDFQARSVVTRPTRHSDHRMVICELVLRAERPRRR